MSWLDMSAWRIACISLVGLLLVSPLQAQVDVNTGEMIQDGPSMVEPLRQFSSQENAQRYYRLTWELRCPMCDHQAIGDSNAPVSGDMRNRVALLIEQGYSDREIVDHMIERWGEGVTFRPRFGAHTLWIWVVGSLLVSFLVAVIIGVRLRHWRRSNADDEALTPEQQARLAALRQSTTGKESTQ